MNPFPFPSIDELFMLGKRIRPIPSYISKKKKKRNRKKMRKKKRKEN